MGALAVIIQTLGQVDERGPRNACNIRSRFGIYLYRFVQI